MSRSPATKPSSPGSSATPCSPRTSTAAAPETPPAPSRSPESAACSRGRTTCRSPWEPTAASPAPPAATSAPATAIRTSANDMKMNWQFGQALNGNIAVMGEIDIATHREFTIAIGFGDGHHGAIAQHDADPCHALLLPSRALHRAMATASPRPSSSPPPPPISGKLARISHNVLLSHEDKTYSGAFIASASIPWGASKGDSDLGGYHLVWTRDMVQTATALLACACGRHRTTAACARSSTSPAPSAPTAASPRTSGSTAPPTGPASSSMRSPSPSCSPGVSGSSTASATSTSSPSSSSAAAFLVRYAPVTQQERWEETAGYSPSTLAAVIAGLICAADIARARELRRTGRLPRELRRLDRSSSRRVDHHQRRHPPPRRQVPLHADHVRPHPASLSTTPDRPRGSLHLANRGPGEKRRLRGPRDHRCRLPRTRPLRHPPRRRSAHRRFAQSRRSPPQDRNALRPLLASLQPRRLRPEERRRPLRRLGTGPRLASAHRRTRPL